MLRFRPNGVHSAFKPPMAAAMRAGHKKVEVKIAPKKHYGALGKPYTEMPDGVPRRIREGRTKIGVSMADLAATLGLHQNTVNDWEKGLYKPSKPNLRKLAQLFGFTPKYILTGKGEGWGGAPPVAKKDRIVAVSEPVPEPEKAGGEPVEERSEGPANGVSPKTANEVLSQIGANNSQATTLELALNLLCEGAFSAIGHRQAARYGRLVKQDLEWNIAQMLAGIKVMIDRNDVSGANISGLIAKAEKEFLSMMNNHF